MILGCRLVVGTSVLAEGGRRWYVSISSVSGLLYSFPLTVLSFVLSSGLQDLSRPFER